jgi:hypothetical protein
VERLVRWTAGEKIVWNCIECTHIENAELKATPRQVRAEVWMSLIHGSRGLIYFVHQFKPTFKEAALLDDPEMVSAVTAINHQIQELAPVLNSPNITGRATVKSSAEAAPIKWLLKQHDGSLYLFTVNMAHEPVRGSLEIDGLAGDTTAQVLGEERELRVRNGKFSDEFGAYAVHLYRLRGL